MANRFLSALSPTVPRMESAQYTLSDKAGDELQLMFDGYLFMDKGMALV